MAIQRLRGIGVQGESGKTPWRRWKKLAGSPPEVDFQREKKEGRRGRPGRQETEDH